MAPEKPVVGVGLDETRQRQVFTHVYETDKASPLTERVAMFGTALQAQIRTIGMRSGTDKKADGEEAEVKPTPLQEFARDQMLLDLRKDGAAASQTIRVRKLNAEGELSEGYSTTLGGAFLQAFGSGVDVGAFYFDAGSPDVTRLLKDVTDVLSMVKAPTWSSAEEVRNLFSAADCFSVRGQGASLANQVERGPRITEAFAAMGYEPEGRAPNKLYARFLSTIVDKLPGQPEDLMAEALARGGAAMVRHLLNLGLDVQGSNSQDVVRDPWLLSLVKSAVRAGGKTDEAAAEALMDMVALGADPKAPNRYGLTPVRLIVASELNLQKSKLLEAFSSISLVRKVGREAPGVDKEQRFDNRMYEAVPTL